MTKSKCTNCANRNSRSRRYMTTGSACRECIKQNYSHYVKMTIDIFPRLVSESITIIEIDNQ